MKKIFTLLTAILLCSGMVVQAYDFDWAWSEINTNGTSKSKNNWNGYPVYRCQFGSNLLLFYTVKTSGTLPTYTINGTAYVMPTIGDNTIQNSGSNHTIVNVDYLLNGGDICSFMVLNGSSGQTTFYMRSGTLTVEEGADGPFIHSKGSTKTYFTTNGTNSTSCTFSIGSAATYRSVSVVSDNTTMGTVSYDIKSGYVYEVDGTYCKHWKNGSTYTLTATPKSGYRFVCWKKGSTQISTNAVTDVTIDGNTTYTAYFAPAQYSITYKDQGNATFTGAHESGYPTTHTYGTATTLKSAAKADYTFDGWYTDQNCTGSPVASLGATAYTSNITLYAKWTYAPAGSTYTLLLDKTGNGTVTVRDADNGNALVAFTNNEAQVTEGHNVSITASPAAGYHLTTLTFADEPVGQNETYEMSEDNITLVAVFEPDVYTITYRDKNNQNFSGVHGSGYPTSHTYGTATNLVNATRDGYTFGGWYTDQNCTGAAVTSLGATAYTSAPTVYAKWRGTITTTVSPSSTYGTVTAGGTYDLNTNATLTATSNNDRYYKFDHWLKDGNNYAGGATITPTVTANAAYTAVFRDANSGTITANASSAAGGSVTVNQPSTTGGSAVTLNASANGGYVFSQWNDGNSDNPRTVYVDGNATYTAQFIVEPAAWGSYSYDNANDVIEVDIEEGADNICDSYWTPYGGDFLYIIAANHTRSTSNYVQLYFKTNTMNYTYPDGRLGVAPGTYLTTTPSYTTNQCGYSTYWFWSWNDIPWEGAVAYTYDDYALGLNEQSCYAADVNYSGNSPSFTQKYKIGNYNDGSEARITVSVGKDGHMHVQVRKVSDNTLLINIGEPAAKHNVSITAPENGTITVSYNDGGAQSFTSGSRSITEGTVLTVTTSPSEGYHFDSWTNDGAASVTVDGNKTIGATFAANTNTAYTVKHYQQNVALDGYTEVEGDRQNLTGTTATATAAAAKEYTGFTAQSFEQGTIAGDGSTVVSIYYNRDKYTVSLAVSPADYGTVSQESVTDVPYGAVIAIGTDENANKVTINGIPVTAAMEFYSFVEWQNTTSVDPVSLSAGSSFNLSGAVSLTAVFELPETIVLRDDFENNSRWQTDYAALRTTLTVNGKVAKRDVQLKRTFNAGRWSTISLPFAYNFSKQGNNTFKGQVYYLISAKYTEQGYLKLNCMPNTYRIEPNKPYIVIPNETIVNPVFNDVTLQSIGDGSYTVENTENIGTGVTFRNTQYRQTLPNNDKRVIYLSSNTLCYPHPEKETYMNAFRGYFYLNVEVEDIHYIQPRRVILETTDGDRIEYAEESNEAISSETHKYIENGILVIERNGIKYDAQGHIIK